MSFISGPPATRVDVVVEEMHGQRIEDPYRWLEDGNSAETHAWVDAQNRYTESVLGKVPGRERICRRLTELLSIGVVTAPRARGDRYFYQRREGDQNQPVLLLREGKAGEERVLLDPNRETAGGTVSLDWWYPSPDGSLLAYGYSSNGDEWSELQVLDVASGTLLPDRIPRARYASVAWLHDNSGFYFTRYPHPGEVAEGEENYNVRVYYHQLGTDPTTDVVIEITPLEREQLPRVHISENGRYLVAEIGRDFYRTDVYVRDLSVPDAPWITIVEGREAQFSAEFGGDTLYLHTNLDAPRYRLWAVDPVNPVKEAWREILPEPEEGVLTGVTFCAGRILGVYLRNAFSSLSIYDATGTHQRDIEFPVLGSITGLNAWWDRSDAYLSFESFTFAPVVYRLEVNGSLTPWASVEAPIEPDRFTVTQEWYTSRDGTRVSMFVVYRSDLDRSRPAPAFLTGYGGFTVSETPVFSRATYLWLEAGGVFALPNLRGGGEYGEEWHRAGMLERKQNVFDDFISAAEHLIDRGYTDREHLAIAGGSNGGLLVGAALTQRPDLFRAVVCRVPLLDMLRYQHFLIARLWIPEYGTADDPAQFPFIYAYSPYHHVQSGTAYPAVLFSTADSDSRVDPLHARKMAALVQAANASEGPILLRIETQAGHGAGKPLAKVIEEQTDLWCFVFSQLGVDVNATV